jgi:hypothetical protein
MLETKTPCSFPKNRQIDGNLGTITIAIQRALPADELNIRNAIGFPTGSR